MDYERFNPCEHERFASLWVWLATDCWCWSGATVVLWAYDGVAWRSVVLT